MALRRLGKICVSGGYLGLLDTRGDEHAPVTNQWSQLDPELRCRRTRAPFVVSDSPTNLQPLTAGSSTARCVSRTGDRRPDMLLPQPQQQTVVASLQQLQTHFRLTSGKRVPLHDLLLLCNGVCCSQGK